MRNLYKNTIIFNLLIYWLIYLNYFYIKLQCSNNTDSDFTYNRCMTLLSDSTPEYLEIWSYIWWVLFIFCISWLIVDWFKFIIKKLKKN